MWQNTDDHLWVFENEEKMLKDELLQIENDYESNLQTILKALNEKKQKQITEAINKHLKRTHKIIHPQTADDSKDTHDTTKTASKSPKNTRSVCEEISNSPKNTTNLQREDTRMSVVSSETETNQKYSITKNISDHTTYSSTTSFHALDGGDGINGDDISGGGGGGGGGHANSKTQKKSNKNKKQRSSKLQKMFASFLKSNSNKDEKETTQGGEQTQQHNTQQQHIISTELSDGNIVRPTNYHMGVSTKPTMKVRSFSHSTTDLWKKGLTAHFHPKDNQSCQSEIVQKMNERINGNQETRKVFYSENRKENTKSFVEKSLSASRRGSYPCKNCSKQFADRQSRDKHILIH